MPERSAAAALQDSLHAFLDARHGNKNSIQHCFWGKHLEEDAQRRRDRAFSKIQDAIKGLHGYGKHGHEADLRYPECMDEKTLCDLHYYSYKKLRDQHGHELFSDFSTRPKTKVGCESSDSKAIDGDGVESEASNDKDHSEYNRSDRDHSDRNGHVDGNDSTAMLADSEGYPDEEDDFEEIISKDAVTKTRKMHMTVYTDGTRALTQIPAEDSKQDGVTASDDKRAPSSDHPTSTRHTKERDVNSRLGDAFLTPEKAVAKLQLSPGSTERGSNLRKHISRSPSDRAQTALVSLVADNSYEKSVAINEALVREYICREHTFDSAKKGTVYAMRDNEFRLVKIGHTGRSVDIRKGEIEDDCDIAGKLIVLEQVEAPAYKMLEKVIQLDLRPHRWFYDCECGKSTDRGFTRHQEWFEIDDVTARRTLRLWADFFEQHPWGCPSPKAHVYLTEKWATRMTASSGVSKTEEHGHHDVREKRWRKFLGLELEATKGSAIASEALPCDTTPSKPSSVPAELRMSPSDQDLSSDETNEIPIKLERNKSFKSQLHAARKTSPSESARHSLQNGRSSPSGAESPPLQTSKADAEDGSSEHSEDKPKRSSMGHHEDRPTNADHSHPPENAHFHAPSSSQSALLLATALLSKELHSPPAQAILNDLWHLRWPLLCCVVFVLHAPYLPPGLVYLMWSFFLPLFVAELRGWNASPSFGGGWRVVEKGTKGRVRSD